MVAVTVVPDREAMNVFIIGFPIKIATGLFFLSMTMPLVFHALNVLFARLDADR